MQNAMFGAMIVTGAIILLWMAWFLYALWVESIRAAQRRETWELLERFGVSDGPGFLLNAEWDDSQDEPLVGGTFERVDLP